MLTFSAKIRQTLGKKVKNLRKTGIIPAILYGSEIKESLPLEIDYKAFEKIYKEAGGSSLISLEIQDEKTGKTKQKKFLVLIHDTKRNPLTEEIMHVDFYQPRLEKEIEAKVPIIFEGEPLAVKESGGTLVKNISDVEIKALPQKLPKEIKVDVSNLETFEDHILIKDLKVSEGVKILKDPDQIVASVVPPEKVEEELVKPIEEKVEEVEKVEEKKDEEEKKEEKVEKAEKEEK